MLLIAFVGLALLTVPLAGGRLTALAELRFRRLWILFAALFVQISIFLPVGGSKVTLGVAHVASYLLAGLFLWANRQMPGMWLIGVGGALNLTAIAANGGIMPTAASTLARAGRSIHPGQFTNSTVVADPNLSFLGDVFALPDGWPFSNVFSIGDICIALGAVVALHRLTRSRLFPSGTGQFAALRSHRDFMRVWGAQAVSSMGDWVYALAVAATLVARGGGPHHFSLLLLSQVGPAAVAGALVGPLIDRFPRKRLMIGADILRAGAVASLLVPGTASLPHLYAVAALLGVLGAVFQPTLQASLPNLVNKEQLVAANALVAMTHNIAVMAGPVIGGVMVATVGTFSAFALNASTFLISAALLSRIHLAHRDPERTPESPLGALTQGARYAFGTSLIRGLLIVIGLVMFGSAIRSPLEPIFVLDTLDGGPGSLGLVGGAWGLGMVLGSLSAPAAARRWSRERLLGAMVAVVAIVVMAASRATALSPVLLLWVASGLANGIGSVAFESLLQERTPDQLRGRIMAASEAIMHGSFLIGALVAGSLAAFLGVRGAIAFSGVVLLATALLGTVMLGTQRRLGVPSWRGARAAVSEARPLAQAATKT
jgi:MFS family permease